MEKIDLISEQTEENTLKLEEILRELIALKQTINTLPIKITKKKKNTQRLKRK